MEDSEEEHQPSEGLASQLAATVEQLSRALLPSLLAGLEEVAAGNRGTDGASRAKLEQPTSGTSYSQTSTPVNTYTHGTMTGWGFPNSATWPPWTPYANGPYPYLRTGYSQCGQAVPQFFASGNATQQVDGANQLYRTVGSTSAAPHTQIQGNAAFQAMGTVALHTQTQGNAAFPVIGSAAPHSTVQNPVVPLMRNATHSREGESSHGGKSSIASPEIDDYVISHLSDMNQKQKGSHQKSPNLLRLCPTYGQPWTNP